MKIKISDGKALTSDLNREIQREVFVGEYLQARLCLS
jgi:hypothetical protein